MVVKNMIANNTLANLILIKFDQINESQKIVIKNN